MAVENNINMYYEELVQGMAERAKDNLDNGGYGDENECIWQAIDDSLIYYTDQAYIMAQAVEGGFVSWGKTIEWDAVIDMLYSDVAEELEKLGE